MEREVILISVCICTYKRETLLDTLNSIDSQVFDKSIRLEICIVDNDKYGSSHHIVNQFSDMSNIKCHYQVEPKQGLSYARNTALTLATGSYFAFIDDDEVAAVNWIAELYRNAIKYDADVIIGSVKTLYPESAPEWIVKGDFFGRSFPSTGHILEVAGIGNALIRRESLPVDMLFDLKYNYSGGEDTDFLYRLTLLGRKIVACKEACVEEMVEGSRLNRMFLLKKALRVGETYQLIILNRKNAFDRKIYFFRSCAQWIIAKMLALVVMPFSNIYSLKFNIIAKANEGKIVASFTGGATELYVERG